MNPELNYSIAAQCAVLSKEIYQSFSNEFEFSHFPNIEKKFINEESSDTQCAIIFDNNNHIIYIVFRGTEGKNDLWTDLQFEKIEYQQEVIENYQDKVIEQEINQKQQLSNPYKKANQSGAKMHQGFSQAYLSVRNQIYDSIKNYGPAKLIVTGHSLGGALATLCALDIHYWLKEQFVISVYTFGSARVGNENFQKSFMKRIPNSYRFVYGMDIVPALPRPWQGYRHVEKEYRMGPRFSINCVSKRVIDHGIDNYINALKSLDKFYSENQSPNSTVEN